MNIALDNNVKSVDFNSTDIDEVTFNGNTVYYKQREMVGTSPMYFKALGFPLKDYRIYGETLQEAGCGERTENLINASIPDNYRVELEPGKIYCLSKYTGPGQGGAPSAYVYDENGNVIFGDYINNWVSYSFICPSYGKYAIISFTALTKDAISFVKAPYPITTLEVYPQTYTPYGYKLPVTTRTVTTPVYIGADALHRSGETADEVSFATGKIIRRVDPDTMQPYVTPIEEDPPVAFPTLTTAVGSDSFTVGTTVQPSAVSITGNIKPEGYGNLTDTNSVYILDKNSVQLTVHGQ